MAKDAKKASGEGAGKSKKVPIIIAVLVLLLGGGGAGAWYFMGAKAENAEKKEEPPKAPVFHPLQPITVNLTAENGTESLLQIGLTFQVPDQAQADLLKLHAPQVQSRLVLLLTSKKASEITTKEGKTQLIKELIETLQQPFSEKGKPQEIVDVLITSFIVQ